MEDLESMMELLPVVERSSTLFWPSQVVEALRSISRGPLHSQVHSGELLFLAISDIRSSLSLSSETFAPNAPDGYALFFDELMLRVESEKWFEQVLPSLANLLLRLPFLLETHYRNADGFLNDGENGFKTGLRLLGSQEAGMVILSQELIGALLACSFLCLFPIANRGAKHLPTINFDILFENLYDRYSEKQEHKIKCIIHYFERISSFTPVGFVSFERKVLHSEDGPSHLSYPKTALWSNSVLPLCHFEVHNSGFIEDQTSEALEVDFANKYLGGGALHRGCVQEEIRFMINPELIAGMLFLPSMADNEAIEIVGVERFSTYKGYASTFRFSGDYMDKKNVDFIGRRKTRIIAIDAVSSPGRTQYKFKSLFREVNKAFCGFLDHQSKYYQYEKMFQESEFSGAQLGHDIKDCNNISIIDPSVSSQEAPSTSIETIERRFEENLLRSSSCIQSLLDHNKIGIATGNWGCGAFGGDPEVKSMIQWLAASQASRPFILYYTFNDESSKNLEQVTRWILSHGWTVGDLWNMLTEYSSHRLKGKTKSGFFTWLLPSISTRS